MARVEALLPIPARGTRGASSPAARPMRSVTKNSARFCRDRHDETAPDILRLHAADKLLERNEGKPVARIVQPPPDPFSLLPDEELNAELKRLRELIEGFGSARPTPGAP